MIDKAPMLSVHNLSIRLGARVVVSDASFALEPGKLIMLVGPNGAGKTSLLRALAGLIPSTGSMHLCGETLVTMGVKERARRIAYLPQGHNLHWPLKAREVVALGRYPHGMTDPTRLSTHDASIVDMALARTDATAFADRNVQTLSGGERARVMMARVFAVGAPVLLADEPTAALDPRHQLMIMGALKEEAARGSLVIAVTHDLSLAARMADAVMVVHEGRIVALGKPVEVLDADLMRQVYGVEALTLSHDGQLVFHPWSIA